MSTISERIKLIRKKNHLNQTQFGEKIGINRDSVSNIELDRNKNGIPDNIIKLIAMTFNVNENWLRTGEGETFKQNNNSLLQQVALEYNLDEFQKNLIQEYLNLTNQQKNAVKSFLDKVYKDMFQDSTNDFISTEKSNSQNEDELPTEYTNMSADELKKQADMIETLLERKQASLASEKQKENSLKNA